MMQFSTHILLSILFLSASLVHGRQARNQNTLSRFSTHENVRELLPTPLYHPTRGGYTPSEPSRRRIRNLFSTSAVAPSPLVAASPKQRWDRPPLVNYDDDEMLDGDWILRHPDAIPEQQPSYVENLKRQVARTSRESDELLQSDNQSTKQAPTSIARLDAALFATYFCNLVSVTIPVILMPLVAAEHAASASHLSVAAIVGTIASISTIGGAVGKCTGGFVVQSIGGRTASSLYLLGLAAASVLLSVSPASHAGYILALIEFLSSVQWTACNLLLANHYEKSPARLAKGITILSLASTSATLVAKIGGTAMLKYVSSWRSVAQLAAFSAFVGAAIMRTLVLEHPVTTPTWLSRRQQSQQQQSQSIGASLNAVLGNPLFWQVGIAHATAMLARTSDRILGAFFHQATALPRSLCGGLTAVVTLGFVHGLMKGRRFHQLQDTASKTRVLSRAYAIAALSAVGMALCSNEWIQRVLFPSKKVLAAVAASITGVLASNISFQFYQIPPMVATTFGNNKALCISLFDGLGFLLAAPVWALTGQIVAKAGAHGWSLAWLMLAALFGVGGKTMMNAIPSVLQQQQRRTAAA